jgi:hypothetical protein
VTVAWVRRRGKGRTAHSGAPMLVTSASALTSVGFARSTAIAYASDPATA